MRKYKIPDADNTLALKETDYYKWLKENKVKNVFDIRVKKAYLKERYYDNKIHNIDLDDYFTLKQIEMHYFDRNVRNNIEKYKYGIFEETFTT